MKLSFSPSSSRRPTPLSLALLAGALGFALNAFNPAVFGGTGVVFGGCFALVVAFSQGPWWGLLAAAIASSRTLFNWGHPLGVGLFSLEAAIVGGLTVRLRWHPLRADALFWVLLGFPLALAGTAASSDVPFPGYWAIAIKMPANGLLVALMAFTAVEFLERRMPRLLGPPPTVTASLRTILFQRFGILAALPIAALGLYVGQAFDRQQRTEASAEIANAALDTAEDVGVHLSEHRSAIMTAARQFELAAESVPASLAIQLEAIRRGYPGFLTLLVANDHGDILATAAEQPPAQTPNDRSSINVLDRDYFKQAVATRRPFVSDVFLGRGLGRDLIVAISAPVLDRDGRVRLVVEGSLNLKRMTYEIGHTHSTEARDVVVTDRRNRIVCSTGALTTPALTSFAGESLYFAARTANGPAFFHDQFHVGMAHPERQLAATSRVAEYGWNVYLQEPVWRSQRPIAVFYLTLMLGSGIAVAAALLLASGTATVVTQPLERLVESAHALAQMSPAVPVFDTGRAPAEIAQLSRDVHTAALHLNHNNAALERSNAELRHLTRTLDQKIHERTADLQAARMLAESANRAKSEFLASMSHELRTPLSVILGNASLLEEGVLGPITDRQRDSARGIEESGRHLLTLINDVLDLSKVEAGMLELDYVDVLVNDVCDASLRLTGNDAARKNLTVDINYRCASDTVLVADSRRVKQILVNLLSNAVKFTPAGGRISLTVDADHDRNSIDFIVADTGSGIALERQRKLFRPFVQIDSRLSREYGGTGLGLALVKQLTDLHGGSVSLVSEPGSGSRFTVSLPLRRETASRAPFVPAATAASTPKIVGAPRILVAEDHETNIAVLNAYFRSQPCETVFARDGVEAIERAFAARPDIILMDVQMPRMDGLEAIARLRADPRTADVPIVCLTALAMADDQERCLAAGANEYLCKPVNFRLLTSTINRLIAAHAPQVT